MESSRISLNLERVTVSDLEGRDPASVARVRSAVQASFGPECPGLIVVTGLEEWYCACREKLLSSILHFASLSHDVKSRYERPDVDYAVGWSHGREKFHGRADTLKGSYYANPLYDDPANGDEEKERLYPHVFTPNVWPSREGGETADMERYFKRIGAYIARLGLHLAWHSDKYVEAMLQENRDTAAGTTFTKLYDSLVGSRAQKGRLLMYDPSPTSTATTAGLQHDRALKESASWFGFHNDHGLLTGLVAGEFYDHSSRTKLGNVVDDHAGLYVVPRDDSNPLRAVLPPDCIGFQTGEAAQILTGGIVRATPHGIRGPLAIHNGVNRPKHPLISRASFALFLQPNPDEYLRLPPWDFALRSGLVNSALVPSLSERYEAQDTFASFGAKTVRAYLSLPDGH